MQNITTLEPSDRHLRADGRNPPSDVESSPSASVSRATGSRVLDGSRTGSPDEPIQATSRTLLTTRFLRKSASADSGIAQRNSTQSTVLADGFQRDDGSASFNEPNSPQEERSDARVLSSPPSVMSLSGYLRSKVSRRRGTSNAVATDNEASAQEDSDIDRSISASGTMKGRVRARLLSLKGGKASGSGAEAGDVPRMPTRDASTSVSNPKLPQPISSKLSQKSTAPSQVPGQVAKKATRSRSHSVGPPSKSGSSKIVKRFSFGNQTPQPEILEELSIAVVGSTGCGKSIFVRKGLKRYNLTNPEPLTSTLTASDTTHTVSYTRRTAKFLTGLNTDTTLSIYEYDSKDWTINKDGFSYWPAELPGVDGVFVCYDGSDRASFSDVVRLASRFKSLDIPTLVIACKADLEKRVPPEDAAIAVDPYGKLIEVSCYSDDGKRRMRKAVDWLVKRVVAARSPSQVPDFTDTEQYSISRDDLLNQKPEKTKNLMLTVQTGVPRPPIDLASPTTPPVPPLGQASLSQPKPSPTFSSAKRSPTKACSMNDMRSSHQRLLVSSSHESDKENTMRKSITSSFSFMSKSTDSFVDVSLPASPAPTRFSGTMENIAAVPVSAHSAEKERPKTRSPPTPWVTLDELLEKLFFLAISGDDPSFISHFFLTYRRFAAPRSVLLGVQKRLNELRKPTNDAVLACFAQMRICGLLELWMREYPSDFAVRGTHGALDAIIRHVLSYSHTLSYGSEFLPFMDKLGTLKDEEAAWALRIDVGSVSDSDNESDGMFDADVGAVEEPPEPMSVSRKLNRNSTSEPPSSPRSSNRERRSSLPFTAMVRIKAPIMNALHGMEEPSSPSPKEIISRLQRVAAALNNYESESIASEITRRELQLFLDIRPRDWLRHTLTAGKKDPDTDRIAKFNSHYNDLHEWAVSLILCHDKPKSRARQIEKFAEVATKLRMLNNYSGLRAMITAINQATYPGDQPMEIFKTKVDLHKKYLSSDILLRTTGAHQSYRMALRNTKGPCIPSLEVHTSDLRRAHEGNPDTKPDDPTKINWAKYNMMGRFIETTSAIQYRCVGANGYRFVENKYLAQLFDVPVMDYEMQQRRVSQPADDDSFSTPPGSSTSIIGSHAKEGSVIRRILQW